jgi:hemerythrin-like metal-binding protein
MALLEWSESLTLGQPVMDETHREFVDLLNRVGAAADSELLARLDEFIAHTEAHFRQEEEWMQALRFPPLACHRAEHEGVLEITREVRARIAAGEMHYGPVFAKAIAEWFPLHAGSMDTLLAFHIKQSGYEPGGPVSAGVGGAEMPR